MTTSQVLQDGLKFDILCPNIVFFIFFTVCLLSVLSSICFYDTWPDSVFMHPAFGFLALCVPCTGGSRGAIRTQVVIITLFTFCLSNCIYILHIMYLKENKWFFFCSFFLCRLFVTFINNYNIFVGFFFKDLFVFHLYSLVRSVDGCGVCFCC